MRREIKHITLIFGLMFINITYSDVMRSNAKEDVRTIQQKKGEYGMLKRPEIPLGTIQKSMDRSKPSDSIHVVDFKRHETIKIRMREQMSTMIELPAWETVLKVVIGDQALLNSSIERKNAVTLHPKEYIGGDTDVHIVGEGHIYKLYVRVEGYESKNVPDIGLIIRARPPEHMLAKDEELEEQETDHLQKSLTNPEDLDFKFSMSGDRSIAPKLVYSDGVRTWLYYGEDGHKKTIPAVYKVVDGVDTPAFSIRQKNAIVVRGKGILTLRNGGKVTCVYPSDLGRHYEKN